MKLISHWILLLAGMSFSFTLKAQSIKNLSASEIELEIKKLRTGASVLYIAAHPDDENTRLISWLANEKCVRTGYLSLTRGDGGQNLIGPEQGTSLGVIRTQELLAARRTDGGEQFFTHAYDFGYSKTPVETFEKWGKEAILADVVYIIRYFQPDIIITRFATDGSGGHGHHTASAILAEEAFEAAANPMKFPEQLDVLDPWKTKSLFYNSAARFWNPSADMSGHLKVNVGSYNVLLGRSYGEIAAESRSMHRSQGFGSARQRVEQYEYFKLIKGDSSARDIFSGVAMGLTRYEGGKQLDALFEKLAEAWEDRDIKKCNQLVIKGFELMDKEGNKLPIYYRKKLQQLLLQLNGIYLEAVSEGSPSTALGDTVKIKVTAINRSSNAISLNRIDLLLNGAVFPSCNNSLYGQLVNEPLKPIQAYQNTIPMYVCELVGPSQLYWLNQAIQDNKFVYPMKEQAEGLSSGVQCLFTLIVEGKPFQFNIPLQYKWVDPDRGEQFRPHLMVPPVTIQLPGKSLLFVNDSAANLKVQLRSFKANIKGSLLCGSTFYPFELNKKGEVFEMNIKVEPSDLKGKDSLQLKIMANDYQQTFGVGFNEIKYDHIPVQTLFPRAEVKATNVKLTKKLKRIGYIPGAGDEVAEGLRGIGYEVINLTDEMIVQGNLDEFATIIIGVRAYNTNDLLSLHQKRLMQYVERGGNLVVQYNTNSFAGPFKGDIGPYPFKISRNRITDEQATVNLLEPTHPLLNIPNKISPKDFEGWVQERSIYEAAECDSRYQQILGMADANEKETTGSLITCKYGKGNYTYTGLVFFRQLPAGNTGAYRLLVNLIELGK